MKRTYRWPAFLLCVSLLFLAACGAEQAPVPERSDTEYIFVHGLSGWGSYDKSYKRMPYWGMFCGDLMDLSGGMCFFMRPGHLEAGYFSSMSEKVKASVSVPVLLTGGVNKLSDAEALLQKGKADLIGVGRALLKDAAWGAGLYAE